MADRGKRDDDLEAVVEAEWQAENRRAWELNRAQSDVFMFVSSRDSIRKRLVRERREAQEAEEQRLRIELLRRQLLERGSEDAVAGEPADRYGKEYQGERVEEVVRSATEAQRNGRKLARTLRNDLAAKTGMTPYAVDMIFRLMTMDPPMLADAGREGWLKVAGHASTTPAWLNLRELETRS